MASTVFPAASGGKTRFALSLTSGTSYTVPDGVTYLNVVLYGGGGGGGGGQVVNNIGYDGSDGRGGQVRASTFAVTPGATVSYAIGAAGGTTTMTGATSATGGNGGSSPGNTGPVGTAGRAGTNGGGKGSGNNVTASAGGAGGIGQIDIEYWV